MAETWKWLQIWCWHVFSFFELYSPGWCSLGWCSRSSSSGELWWSGQFRCRAAGSIGCQLIAPAAMPVGDGMSPCSSGQSQTPVAQKWPSQQAFLRFLKLMLWWKQEDRTPWKTKVWSCPFERPSLRLRLEGFVEGLAGHGQRSAKPGCVYNAFVGWSSDMNMKSRIQYAVREYAST